MKYHIGVGPVRGEVYVFASNLAGIHTETMEQVKAAAAHGAEFAKGMGRTGNAYAIATKSATYRAFSRDVISTLVHTFLDYAHAHPELEFFVTDLGLPAKVVGPMFGLAPANVRVPKAWQEYTEDVRA